MRKQWFGITLFVLIVTVAIITDYYLGGFTATDCASSREDKCAPPPKPLEFDENEFGGYRAEDIGIRLDYVEASVKYQTVKARAALDWQGRGTPLKNVWVQLQFHNPDGSSAGWMSEPLRISDMFENGRGRTVEPMFDCAKCANLPRNLYASVRIWTRSNSDSKLVYEINQMKPVLVGEGR